MTRSSAPAADAATRGTKQPSTAKPQPHFTRPSRQRTTQAGARVERTSHSPQADQASGDKREGHKLSAAATQPHALTNQPWWTPADQAELDLLTYELVEAGERHAARAPDCCHGDLSRCDQYAHVIQTVLDWRDHRIADSRAAWLRAVQTTRETRPLQLVETA